MNRKRIRSITFYSYLAGIIAFYALGSSPAQTPPSPQKKPLATIIQTGSTNTAGYKVAIFQDGSATAERQLRVASGELQDGSIHTGAPRTGPPTPPPSLRQFAAGTVSAAKLQALLARIGDVSTIPTGHCIKSVSFGTRTMIEYQGKTSGDLQCVRGAPGSPPDDRLSSAQELSRMVQEILRPMILDRPRIMVQPRP